MPFGVSEDENEQKSADAQNFDALTDHLDVFGNAHGTRSKKFRLAAYERRNVAGVGGHGFLKNTSKINN